MSLTAHHFARRMALCVGLSLTLSCFIPMGVLAAAPPAVEAYPYQEDDGSVLNKPLKAGELRLSKTKTEKTAPVRTLSAPRLPVGAVTAPKLPTQKDGSASNSTAGMMMMQGMRIVLQKAGQNPDLPKSNVPVALTTTQAKPATAAPVVLASPSVLEEEQLETVGEDGVRYEKGHAPVNLASGKPLAAESKKSLASSEMPKATELDHQPLPLDQMGTEAITASVSAKTEKTAGTSIFGAPVMEPDAKSLVKTDKPQEQEKAMSLVSVEAPAKPCDPSVSTWSKSCIDAGYPSGYVGQLAGETRVLCPGGEVQDVWLTNTCALPAIGAAKPALAVVETKSQEKSIAKEALVDSYVAAAPVAPVAKSLGEPALPKQAKADSVLQLASVDESASANCGAANGLPAEAKPAVDLCAGGTASSLMGEGPWFWSCKDKAGVLVSCAAPMMKANLKKATPKETALAMAEKLSANEGKCGAAHDVGVEEAPKTDLCAQGPASRVNGAGPWTWACSGVNAGKAAACLAPKKIHGACGVSNNTALERMPERDLCATGYASAVNGDGPWQWTCSGLHGGSAVTCAAGLKAKAVCGKAAEIGHRKQPKDALCEVGDAASVEGSGPWNWVCAGVNGGDDAKCSAAVSEDGACGSANGKSFEKEPSEALCANGKASALSGNGPWHWTCAGAHGGTSIGCTALMGKQAEETAKPALPATSVEEAKKSEPSAATITEASSPEDAIANAAKAYAPTPLASPTVPVHAASAETAQEGAKTEGYLALPKTAASSEAETEKATKAVAKAAEKPVKEKSKETASCGASADQMMTEAPAKELCLAGKAGKVSGSGPWSWVCSGKDGKKAMCVALLKRDGVCGEMNGAALPAAPTSQLCSFGSASLVEGAGPWTWTCTGIGGGDSISCSASVRVQKTVDGICGSSAETTLLAAPTTGLCSSGKPSTVHGEGPWTWSCSGLNGGQASVCSANNMPVAKAEAPGAPVDANCGPSNGVAYDEQPEEGLCTSGTPTGISGHGPWNWNCVGSNGGMSVSCTAPLMPSPPVNGSCGSANGVPTTSIPRSGLCYSGIASAVSGKGPWVWSCSGVNGGGAVSCVAPTSGNKGGSLPSMVSPASADPSSDEGLSTQKLLTPQLSNGMMPPLSLQGSSVPEAPSEMGDIPSGPKLATPSLGVGIPKSPKVAPDLPPSSGVLVPPAPKSGARSLRSPKSMEAPAAQLSSPLPKLEPSASSVPFEKGSDKLDDKSKAVADKIASTLLSHSGARITLIAGADGSDSSPRDARRLSLNRALALKDYLSDQGVPSDRIDVRAMGQNLQGKNLDRVEVKIN